MWNVCSRFLFFVSSFSRVATSSRGMRRKPRLSVEHRLEVYSRCCLRFGCELSVLKGCAAMCTHGWKCRRMSEKKPTHRIRQPSGKVCPVCGQKTYSQGGIHPQCAVYQADTARAEKLKSGQKREAIAAKRSTWSKKKCPKCSGERHVRLKICDCGHVFL